MYYVLCPIKLCYVILISVHSCQQYSSKQIKIIKTMNCEDDIY